MADTRYVLIMTEREKALLAEIFVDERSRLLRAAAVTRWHRSRISRIDRLEDKISENYRGNDVRL